MCFSAGASFGASVILGTIGVVTVKKTTDRTQVPFAAIPLIFAVQQFSEGVLWIGLTDPAHASWQHLPVYIFLIFAQLIWPSWIPFALLRLETNPARKKWLQVFLAMGLTTSGYLLYCLFFYEVSAEIQSGHIHYILNFPFALAWITSILYFIPTVMSLFVSSIKGMMALAFAILISFFATKIFFDDYLISVWCFFAAGLSLMVLWITSMFISPKESITA